MSTVIIFPPSNFTQTSQHDLMVTAGPGRTRSNPGTYDILEFAIPNEKMNCVFEVHGTQQLQSPTVVHVLEERCGCAVAPSVVSSSHMPTPPQLRLFDTESGALSAGELLVAAGDVNISCWVKSQKQAAAGHSV